MINTKLIDNFLKENNLSKTQFCKLCNISLQTLKNVYLSNNKISVKPIVKLALTMKVRLKDLIGVWYKI